MPTPTSKLTDKSPNPAEKDVTKTANFDNDDEFEDFTVQEWKESEADLKKLPLWEDTWEDDDTTVDFAVQLSKQNELKQGVAPMKLG